MNYFFDTSALIKAYIEEEGSKKVKSIINNADDIFISQITFLECLSTIRRLFLLKSINESTYQLLKNKLKSDFNDYNIITFTLEIEKVAEDLIHQFQLKTLDSIQLASCVQVKDRIKSFVVSDDKLISSSLELKISTLNPIQIKS